MPGGVGNNSPHAPGLTGWGSVCAMAAAVAALPPAYWLVDCPMYRPLYWPLYWPLYCPLYCPLVALLDLAWASTGLSRANAKNTAEIVITPNFFIALAQPSVAVENLLDRKALGKQVMGL